MELKLFFFNLNSSYHNTNMANVRGGEATLVCHKVRSQDLLVRDNMSACVDFPYAHTGRGEEGRDLHGHVKLPRNRNSI